MAPSRMIPAQILKVAALTFFALSLIQTVAGHEHHDEDIPEGQGHTAEPLVRQKSPRVPQPAFHGWRTGSNLLGQDNILWIHILVQVSAWGLIFPLGMVLGLVRSRWHVPVQAIGASLALVGHFLGHAHKGRKFGHNVHSSFAPWLEWGLVAQVGLGVYLKLHLERPRILYHFRNLLVIIHGVLGKALPIAAWTQFLFGGIVAMGFCRGDHLGQCAAHFIMGSAFIAYGILLVILLLVGQQWLRRRGKSQEFFDSAVIAAWGCVNTFTEHRWGGPWVRNDLQHTSMGIIWWCAGLLGLWLSRTRDGRPKRNLIPAMVIFFTGYGMSGHPQELMLSTMVHSFFGYTLMAAGVARAVEISFVLKDKDCVSVDGRDPASFQYMTPFLLCASGFLFMGATEEQMQTLSAAHVTHVSYILILLSIAFLLFLFVNILVHIYAVAAMPESAIPAATHFARGADDDLETGAVAARNRDGVRAKAMAMNGHAPNGDLNGGATLGDRDRQRVRDAQEFELTTLLGDEDDEDDNEDERRGNRRSRRKTRTAASGAAAAAATADTAGGGGGEDEEKAGNGRVRL